MNDVNLKQNWRMMCSNQEDDIRRIINEELLTRKRKTSLMHLAERYRRFMIFGLVWAVISLCGLHIPLMRDTFRVPGLIFMIMYFLLCAFMDWRLYTKVRSINPLEMPTIEVIRQSYECRKLHLIFVAILLPLALLLVGWMEYVSQFDSDMLWGIGIGALVGIGIGLYQLSRFLSDYRSIISDTES